MSEGSDKDMDLPRKVWLAGIGAYGRAIGDAQGVYAKMGKETSKAFEDLVGRGESLEAKVTDVAKHYAPKMASETVKTTVDGFSERLERMKATLGLTEVAAQQSDQLTTLSDRLDRMEGKLDAILAGLEALSVAPQNTESVDPTSID
jgi:hypothetical protein